HSFLPLMLSFFLKFWDWDCAYMLAPPKTFADTRLQRKELLLLILVIELNCDMRYRFGNTLRFPRVTREPPCPDKGYVDVVCKDRFSSTFLRSGSVGSHFGHYPRCDGCLERRTLDSCGNSTCLKTPQSGFLEEAEAVTVRSGKQSSIRRSV